MLISHKHKFIYFRIYKNASTTLTGRLSRYCEDFHYIFLSWEDFDKNFFKKLYHPQQMDAYLKFAVCSNPYDHAYSGYFQCRYDMKDPVYQKTFSEVIHQALFNPYLGHQHDFVGYEKNEMDAVLYLERLEEDYEKLCEKLKLPYDNTIKWNVKNIKGHKIDPHNMKLTDYKYLKHYTAGMISIINHYMRKDFDFFGYQKLDPNDFPKELPDDYIQ